MKRKSLIVIICDKKCKGKNLEKRQETVNYRYSSLNSKAVGRYCPQMWVHFLSLVIFFGSQINFIRTFEMLNKQNNLYINLVNTSVDRWR